MKQHSLPYEFVSSSGKKKKNYLHCLRVHRTVLVIVYCIGAQTSYAEFSIQMNQMNFF